MNASKRHGLAELLTTYEATIVRLLTIVGLVAALATLVQKAIL